MDKANDLASIRNIGGKTGAAMWAEVDDLIKRWVERNPFGANWNRIYNENVRYNLDDKKFAVMKKDKGQTGTRSTISVHPELMNYIETFYPKFFDSKENVRKFGNTYKMFKIPEAGL